MDVALKEYVDRMILDLEKRIDTMVAASAQRHNDQKEAVQLAFDSAEKAVLAAAVEAKHWRDSANEWRGAMTDREREFVRGGQHAADISHLREETRTLKERMDRGDGRGAGLNAGWAYLVAGVSTLVALFTLFIYLRPH